MEVLVPFAGREPKTRLADRAENEAQRNARTRRTLLYGGGAVLLLVVLGAGWYVYQSRKQGPSRLR